MRIAWRIISSKSATRQRTQAIVDHILTGGSLASYARRRGAPCRNTLYEWMQRDAAFAAQVAEACEHREDWYLEQQFEAERRALATATSMRAVRKAGAPYARQMARLKNRPGRGTAARWPRPLP